METWNQGVWRIKRKGIVVAPELAHHEARNACPTKGKVSDKESDQWILRGWMLRPGVAWGRLFCCETRVTLLKVNISLMQPSWAFQGHVACFRGTSL